jgi:hypothetical protein
VTARQAAPQGKRKPGRMTYAEVLALMRRSYQEPIPVAPSLHQMAAKRRTPPAGTDSQAGDNTTTERNQS